MVTVVVSFSAAATDSLETLAVSVSGCQVISLVDCAEGVASAFAF